MKILGPYVGITGFTRLDEVVACSTSFHKAKTAHQIPREMPLRLMAGVLVSQKTLGGEINKWPNRYPPVGDISKILALASDPNLLRTIHYNTNNPEKLDEQIDNLMEIAPGDIDALQLNIRWASHVTLLRVKRKYPDLRIILQIGAGALEDVEESGDIYIGRALRGYEGIVDDYLVDPSGGKGQPLDVWKALACLTDSDAPKSIAPGVAGGRDADNIHELQGPMRRLGRLINVDAEGRLRTPGTAVVAGAAEDRLEILKAAHYLWAYVRLVAKWLELEPARAVG